MSKKLPFAHFKTLKRFSMKDLWLLLRRAPPYFNHLNSHIEKLNYNIIDPQWTVQVSKKNYHLCFKKQEKDKIIAQGKQEPDSIREITSKTYQSHTNSPHKQLWGQLSFSTSDLVLLESWLTEAYLIQSIMGWTCRILSPKTCNNRQTALSFCGYLKKGGQKYNAEVSQQWGRLLINTAARTEVSLQPFAFLQINICGLRG